MKSGAWLLVLFLTVGALPVGAPVSATEFEFRFENFVVERHLWVAWNLLRPAPDLAVRYSIDERGRIDFREGGTFATPPHPTILGALYERLFLLVDRRFGDSDGLLTWAEMRIFRPWIITRYVAFEEEARSGARRAAERLNVSEEKLRQYVREYLDFFGAPLPQPRP